jgi:hypothetical protein
MGDDTGVMRSTYKKLKNCARNISWKHETRDDLEYVSSDERIILKWILNKSDVIVWTGFKWDWTETSGGILWTRQWILRIKQTEFCGYHKTTTKLTFSTLSSAKRHPHSASFTGPHRWQSQGARSGLWAGWERTVHHIFAIASRVHKLVSGWALSWRRRTSFMFRLERTLLMCCCSLFKVSLYHSWCDPKSRHRILQHWYTASYSTLAKVYWK